MFETAIGVDGPLALLRQWMTDGAVVQIVGLWIGLSAVSCLIQLGLRRVVHLEYLVQVPAPSSVSRRLTRFPPHRPLRRRLPAFERDEYGSSPVNEDGPWAFAQVVFDCTVGVLFEEGMLRGIPLLAALLLGVDPLWFVGAGTLIWAFLHGLGSGIAFTLTTGWLLAALWLTGNWELGIGLHLANNLAILSILWFPYT